MKQMKALLIAAFVLFAFVGVVFATTDTVEIRSSVLHYNKEAIIGPSEWAGLYYDLNKGIGTEKISVSFGDNTNITIKYITTTQQKNFEFSGWNDDYSIVGFFSDPYVAISKIGESGKANKIAKLVLDSNEKYILKTGEPLDLGCGYSLIAKQIDTDGNKVWFELLKDGKIIDDSIVSVNYKEVGSKDWILEQTILGDKGIQIFRVHVNQIFQGSDSLVEIRGIWLIDATSAFEVRDTINYGKFECIQASSNTIIYLIKDLSLQPDSIINLGKDILLKTEKSFNKYDEKHNTFYFLKLYSEPGEYIIRGPSNSIDLNPGNFAGFYYDIDDGFGTESLTGIINYSKHLINKDDLIYSSNSQLKTFNYNEWGQYKVIDLFGKPYIPLQKKDSTISKDEKLAHLLCDNNDKFTLNIGESLDLGYGYSLIAKQIDTDGNKVWFELLKDGEFIDNSIVSINTNDTSWILEKNICGEKDVVIFRVHVNQVFQGTESSIVEIKGLWLIDFNELNILTLSIDQSFGKFSYKGMVNGSLIFKSNDDIVFSRDTEIDLVEGYFIKVADNENLDFFVFSKKNINDDTNDIIAKQISLNNVINSIFEDDNEILQYGENSTEETEYEENITTSSSFSKNSDIFINNVQEQFTSSNIENRIGKRIGIIFTIIIIAIGFYYYWLNKK